ncbi:uncharacterized protein ATC70_004034 [Mucor velutinosus]|uniref:BZIP domain-containing protein n=1 Tax=Mucor velutinosus TaxID=708070 RepID=A0AAN7HWC8_9FUNG|nr:hypothetical protein ATC70_004034 [Mucor velutinosus]
MPKLNAKEQSRPPAIDTATQAEAWPPHLDALNQIMTPVQLLNDDSLQQELDFYTRAQFKLADTSNTAASTTSTAAATPISTATAGAASYFDSLNIPSDQQQQDYDTNQFADNSASFASLLFTSQQQQPTHSNDGSLLLAHEPRPYQQQPLYSNNSTPANSTPNSPIVHLDVHHHRQQQQQHYVEQNQDADRFAAMFLSSSASATEAAPSLSNAPIEPWTNKEKRTATPQKFRFKQDTKQQQQHQPLDSKLLSKHNMEQDKKSGIKRPLKNKQKASTGSTEKKPSSRNRTLDSEEDSQDDSQDENGNYDAEDGDEDAPFIGDGAQSYSSMGSNSSRTSQPLTKDDKRRRNTAASARFRIKKKMREQALQNTACEMTDKAQRMEQRVHELEREIKWLKALVVEKNQVRIEQLVRERPPESTAFSSLNNSHATASSSASTSAASSSRRNRNQIMMMMATPNNDQQQDNADQQDGEQRAGKGRHHGGQRRRS